MKDITWLIGQPNLLVYIFWYTKGFKGGLVEINLSYSSSQKISDHVIKKIKFSCSLVVIGAVGVRGLLYLGHSICKEESMPRFFCFILP